MPLQDKPSLPRADIYRALDGAWEYVRGLPYEGVPVLAVRIRVCMRFPSIREKRTIDAADPMSSAAQGQMETLEFSTGI